MTVKKLYERVCLILEKNVSRQKFLGFFNDTVYELISQYDKNILFGKNEDFVPVVSLFDTTTLAEEFSSCVLSNILFCFSHKEFYRAEFLRNSLNTYLSLWQKASKGRRIGVAKKED